ncbi:MAG: NYN domain-containing protein [Deinococcales bacterium]
MAHGDALTEMPVEGGSLRRIALFVDTQNLYYAARDGYDATVDYGRLLELALRGRELAAATAYVVEREGDSSAFGFVTKLSALGYRVRRRSVRVHRADDGGKPVMEGDWDMGIAADMVRALPYVDVLVLGSGDGDFVPMLELAQQRGKRVEVLAFREAAAQSLIDLVDRFTHLADETGIFVDRS